MPVWDDPTELGKRLAAARAYSGETLAGYAKLIGKSDKTVAKMERGDPGSLGRSPAARKQTAELAVEAGAPPEFFGLDQLQGITRSEMDELIRELRATAGGPHPAPGEGGGP